MLLLALGLGAAAAVFSVVIWALVSQAVADRGREFGIRQALGATRADLTALVMGRTAVIAIEGTAVGASGATMTNGWLRAFVYGTRPGDAGTVAGVIALLVVVAMAASYIPARRAARLSPSALLNTDR